MALALLAVAVNVQIVHADDYIVRAHLGMQADGGRRFEYNPRVLDIVRLIPRGTIYDRRGVPLATDDPSVMRGRAADATRRLACRSTTACPMPGERCYPLGGAAFHLLGDARTRRELERAATRRTSSAMPNDELRGFDDHAAVVHTTDAQGRPMLTVRRDYRDLVPLLRHRHEPASAGVRRDSRQPHATCA